MKVKVLTREMAASYDVRIEGGVLHSCGGQIRRAVGKNTRKAVIVSNKKVFGLYGETVVSSLHSAGFEICETLIGGGERFKNLKTLEQVLSFFSSNGIARTDTVIALGGGVVGDIAGFAASIHLRGVPYVQIPTTLLSMIDSSVGGKTGVNTKDGKNLVGTFYHPKIVLIDPEVLSTLPKREFTAGLCEAVKQGAISGTALFEQTVSVIDQLEAGDIKGIDLRFRSPLNDFLANQIAFKAQIVGGDERESAKKTDPRSRKTLNFGHTFGHALESATDYKHLKHGEAVGYGILFSAELSKKLGILDRSVVNLLRGVVHRTGVLPSISGIDRDRVFKAISHDKKNLDGTLHWVLLKAIGKPVIVPHHKIGDALVKKIITQITSQ